MKALLLLRLGVFFFFAGGKIPSTGKRSQFGSQVGNLLKDRHFLVILAVCALSVGAQVTVMLLGVYLSDPGKAVYTFCSRFSPISFRGFYDARTVGLQPINDFGPVFNDYRHPVVAASGNTACWSGRVRDGLPSWPSHSAALLFLVSFPQPWP